MAKQLISSHGRNAALQAELTAARLTATGDQDGAARWRRIRDAIVELARQNAGDD